MPFVVRERRAYASIEEARLWCEDALGQRFPASDRRVLMAVHREIGLAGLHASHNLRAERRRAMLGIAHARAEARNTATRHAAAPDALRGLIDDALDHVRQALGVEGLCDEMAQAERRLLTAGELLAALRGDRRRLTTV